MSHDIGTDFEKVKAQTELYREERLHEIGSLGPAGRLSAAELYFERLDDTESPEEWSEDFRRLHRQIQWINEYQRLYPDQEEDFIPLLKLMRPDLIKPSDVSFDIFQRGSKFYDGPVPKKKYLVDGFFPMSSACLFVAAGGVGKGMMSMDLGLNVACSTSQRSSFGPPVLEHGTAVIFYAEDDDGEIRRRLNAIDPMGLRHHLPEEHDFFFNPLPNMGGVFSITESTKEGFRISEIFKKIRGQLLSRQNIKLIAFDPLPSFTQTDINANPAAGAFLMNVLQELATETGACVIATMHTGKPLKNKGKSVEPETLDDLCHSTRGTSALVNGARSVYVLGIAPKGLQEDVFKKSKMMAKRNAVYIGGIGKANGQANWGRQIFLRSEFGLLENITEKMEKKSPNPVHLEKVLLEAIAFQENKNPFTKTKKSSPFERKHELPEELQSISRREFPELIDRLLDEQKLGLYEKINIETGKGKTQYLGIMDGYLSKQIIYDAILLPLFVSSIKRMEDLGQPLNQSGASAPWKRKHLLHTELQELTQYQLQLMMEDALKNKLIVLSLHGTSSKNAQWLCIPNGGLATDPDTYVFKTGAV